MKGAIDLVVVNHRTPAYLGACLSAIEKHPPSRPHHVTVVHTCPEQADMEASARFISTPAWTEVVHEENIGYNRACNHAAARGSQEFIAFLNADAAPLDGTFDQLIDALEANEDWGVVGPRQVDGNNRLTAAGIFGTPQSPRHRGWLADDHGQFSDVRTDAIMIAGSFLVMRRDAFAELTTCDTYQTFSWGEPGPWGRFAHFYGDTWLSYHARAHGWTLCYHGPTAAKHHWHKSTTRGSQFIRDTQSRDKELYRLMCAHHGIRHE